MSSEQFNVVIIMTDQQRGDCLGVAGHPVLQTPNLDALARHGCWFRRGYAESPSCIPARRTLLSGMAPAANGMVGYRGGVAWNPPATLPGELRKVGYQTQLIGKLHLHPPRRRFGFDHVILSEATRGNDDYNEYLIQNGVTYPRAGVAHGLSSNGWVARPCHLPEHLMHAFWCTSRAIEFIEKRDPSCPFFLKLSFIDPHPPLTPPAFYYDRYINQELPQPFVGEWVDREPEPQRGLSVNAGHIHLDEQVMRQTRAAYYGMINFIDDQIGRFLNFLDDRNALDQTLVIFTSDHGEMLGDHGLFRKAQPYEPSSQVPFIFRMPAALNWPAGLEPRTPAGLQDIMPTVLNVVGSPIPKSCTGVSLVNTLSGHGESPRQFLHGEHARHHDCHDGMHFIVDKQYKYVWFTKTGCEQLFDLSADPHELRDLAPLPEYTDSLACQRSRLIKALNGRPEYFVRNNALNPGREHDDLVPGYAPDTVFSFQ